MRQMNVVTLMVVTAIVLAHGQTRTVDFAQDVVDRPPRGFEFGHTAGVGRPGRRVVQVDGGNHVLAQLDPDQTGSRFPVALSVRFKPISGQIDQAAGLVWRYQDQNNYYVVRANAREDNVVLYKVERARGPIWP